jgi:hypothetical protein
MLSTPDYAWDWDAPRDCLNLWLEIHLARGEVFSGHDGKDAKAAAMNHRALP